ncbi:hypothetical protein MVEN_01984100 [Mycena venus]|uniref:Uncharacterized protein n=1 Tax=Mycena venus TaxID=2733690 RepID=A0A8H6XDF9_9AGAR|nr:hypothetical protein MVEN_01984100 [Mycena venus]
MEASSLPIQDIWDEILDYADSHTELKSFALVCRAFVSRAQMLLFHTVRAYRVGRRTALWLDGRRFPLMMSTDHLMDFYSHVPHLIGHIRELSIDQVDAKTLAPIVQISWTSLRKVSFDHCREPLGSETLDLIGTLISLPTLHEISFTSFLWESHQLRTILAKCGSAVRGLKFDLSGISDADFTHLPAPIDSHRPRITSVDLSNAGGIPDLLLHAKCPLDMSHLEHVAFLLRSSTGIPELLLNSKKTIRSLRFDGEEADIGSLDLGEFPILSHIAFWRGAQGLQNTFERSRSLNNLRTISYCHSSWDAEGPTLSLLDSIVSRSRLPALREVVVRVWASTLDSGYSDLRSAIEKKVPWLVQNGLLVVKIDRW